MNLPGGVAAGAYDKGSAGLPPRPGKGVRVLLFLIYFFVFAVGIPALTIAVVQAKYGLIDGPPSFPPDAFGEQIKTAAKYGIFVWAGLQFFIFGRVASWAGSEPAVPGVPPIAKEVLISRLLALNQQDIPFAVSRGSRANELVIDWRYADAKWLDLMRLHGMSKGYRLVLRFDEGAHNARAQDRYASFDWSAGLAALAPSLDLPSLGWRESGLASWTIDCEPFCLVPSLPSAVPARMPPEPEVVAETLAGAK